MRGRQGSPSPARPRGPALPAVESTFSQAAAPPSTSSTSFSRGYFLLVTCGSGTGTAQRAPGQLSGHRAAGTPPRADPAPPAPRYLPRDIAHVGTGGAGEAVAARPLLGHQHVPAGRAEEQHRRFRRAARPFRRWRPSRLRRSRPRSWRTRRCWSCSRRRWRGWCRTRCSATSPRRWAQGAGPGCAHGRAALTAGPGSRPGCGHRRVTLPQVTAEEIGSQVALEYGQAMTVRVCKADGETLRACGAGRGRAGDRGAAGLTRLSTPRSRGGGAERLGAGPEEGAAAALSAEAGSAGRCPAPQLVRGGGRAARECVPPRCPSRGSP